MNISFTFTRTYIRISHLYDTVPELKQLDLMALIRAVAKANPVQEGIVLYEPGIDFVYLGRTKRFIVGATNLFLRNLREIYSETESMTRTASKNQLDALIRACHSGKKDISCNGLIIIYVMFQLLHGKSDLAAFRQALSAFHQLVLGYFEENPDDLLAEFFVGTFPPIDDAIRANNISLTGQALPCRPHRQPKA